MTDRPRVWTLWGGPKKHPLFDQGIEPGETVRAVEWDEERTVAAMERVIAIRSERPCSPRDIAEAIFDALGPDPDPTESADD